MKCKLNRAKNKQREIITHQFSVAEAHVFCFIQVVAKYPEHPRVIKRRLITG
jgi:hypothetical protein